jgi:hypothetical protein
MNFSLNASNLNQLGRRRGKWLVLPLFALLMLTLCSNPKAANKGNFKAVLSKYFAQSCMVLPIGSSGSTLGGIVGDSVSPPTDLSNAGLTPEQITALEKSGLVTEKQVVGHR